MTDQTEKKPSMEQNTQSLRLLFLLSAPTMREAVPAILENYTKTFADLATEISFNTEAAESLDEIVKTIDSNPPDILLMEPRAGRPNDISIPGTVLQKGSLFPIIIVTHTASVQAAAAATRQGAFDFMLQPFTPADLRYTVCRAARHVLLTRRTKELEEEKKRVRFDFIRVLGHELKAPLGAVTTNIGILTGRYLGNDVEAYDKLMQRCLVRLEQMRKLIIDLLDMTRLESGQKQRDLAPTDITRVVADTVELLTPQAEERGIGFEVDTPESCMLLADPGEISMILNNLVSNAVKYNRDNGRVFITLKPCTEGVTLSVRDTGIGMTAEEVSKLFGEFVRIRNKKTANILGSGLGLSILKRLVELYNGKVSVESTPDEGTTFHVLLKQSVKENTDRKTEEYKQEAQ